MWKISPESEEFYFLQASRYPIGKKFVSVMYYVVMSIFCKTKSGQHISCDLLCTSLLQHL